MKKIPEFRETTVELKDGVIAINQVYGGTVRVPIEYIDTFLEVVREVANTHVYKLAEESPLQPLEFQQVTLK